MVRRTATHLLHLRNLATLLTVNEVDYDVKDIVVANEFEIKVDRENRFRFK